MFRASVRVSVHCDAELSLSGRTGPWLIEETALLMLSLAHESRADIFSNGTAFENTAHY